MRSVTAWIRCATEGWISSRIESQLQDAAATRSRQFRGDDDQATSRIERDGHNVIAVSPGIVPVYTIANRLGRIWTARR
jgi:hypothetical protein